ncbi:hypothetical protein DIQ79_15410 [Mycolicibacterium smegmatis]|uniref:Uncharacterized protein n=1 Tax=Mycolicibacterium smegmatis (strain ATCC 700084 / mc(2)155) TaxID=246196 RepID=A0QXD1_MYCS2|nr:hypothetical protein MSMEG_3258 [Mycolicibacterium smegmatis MC2 155]TBM38321.1 hypothetical protein DIQ86_29435 [Mycolicibacterium smegmatis]TBH44844.1 hypothetical protein EYS45_14995 [Mycolicibacterium smegmatis MC2 155]TBM50118.1 hypothetical protein DIQ85_16380 [Mycolicibacterium smegmatis]TBM61118.1 hypothetical protein DIQ83_16440 [Mycolicibacterium smegmatis]
MRYAGRTRPRISFDGNSSGWSTTSPMTRHKIAAGLTVGVCVTTA